MRRLRSAESPLSAGLPSINDAIAIPSLCQLPTAILQPSTDGSGVCRQLRDYRQPGRRSLLVGVIAAADQRTGLHVAETHLESFGFELGEFTRGIQTRHGKGNALAEQVLTVGG